MEATPFCDAQLLRHPPKTWANVEQQVARMSEVTSGLRATLPVRRPESLARFLGGLSASLRRPRPDATYVL
jgi:hypothetical protein